MDLPPSAQPAPAVTNAFGGTFTAASGSGSSKQRFIQTDFNNSGNISVEADVTIFFNQANTTFTINGGVTTNSGTVTNGGKSSATLTINGGTITNPGTFPWTNGTVNFNGGAINSNPIIVQSGTLNLADGPGDTGLFQFRAVANTLSGNVSQGNTVAVLGLPGVNTQVAASAAFSNSGSMNFDTSGNGHALLALDSGTLTNSFGASMSFDHSGGGSIVSRFLSADIINDESVTVLNGSSLIFDSVDKTFTNNNGITVDLNSAITNGGENNTFTQAAGQLSNNNSFSWTNGSFNFSGGTITGNDLVLTNVALNLSNAPSDSGSVNMGGGANTMTGDVEAATIVNVRDRAGINTLVTAQGPFNNTGTMTFETTSNGTTTLAINGGALPNTATGTMEFNGSLGGSTLVRQLRGDVINDGDITVVNGANLQFSLPNTTLTNNAIFSVDASSSSTNSSAANTFTQAGGTLSNSNSVSWTNGTFNFSGATITGNDLVLTNVALNLSNGPSDAGSLQVSGSSSLTGNVEAATTIKVVGMLGLNASLTSAADFSNRGTIILTTTGNGSPTLAVTAGTFTNEVGGVMIAELGTGSNDDRFVNAHFLNQGTLTIEGDTDLFVTKSAGAHANAGSMTIGTSGRLHFTTGTSFTNELSGVISGNGTLDVATIAFTNNETVGPGISPGVLNVVGNYNQSASSTLAIELGGLVVGTENDQLVISSDAALNGTMAVSLINALVPDYDDSFQVVTYATRSEKFDLVTGAFVGVDKTLAPIYGANSLTLIAALPGDGDLNGIVNFADFVLLANNFGQQDTDWEQGNFDLNNLINFADCVILANHFGQTITSPGTVPEPAMIALFGIGMLGVQ